MPQLDGTRREPMAADQEIISFAGEWERGGENQGVASPGRVAHVPYSVSDQSDSKEPGAKEPEQCMQVKWPLADTEPLSLWTRPAPKDTASPFPACASRQTYGCPGPTLQPSQVAVLQRPRCAPSLAPLVACSGDHFPCLIRPSCPSAGAEPEIRIPRQPHMADAVPAYHPFSPEATGQMPHPVGWLISQQNQSVYPLVQGGFNHLYPSAVTFRTSLSNGGVPSRLLSPRVSPRYSFHAAAIPHVAVAVPRFGQEDESSYPASRPRDCDSKNGDEKTRHIKKPLNAFMLYMKEMRAKVVSECMLKESAAINQILGRRWHALSREEQGKYYELAKKERLRHMQLYPGWSARDNYGKKKRRKREKLPGEGHVK